MKLRSILFSASNIVLLPLLLCLCCCGKRESLQQGTPVVEGTPLAHEEYNSVYYWRTVFQLDSTERQFMAAHSVKRLYIRMFDVTENIRLGDDNLRVEKVVPNATIVFRDSVPAAHVVPTVYITVEALQSMAQEGNLDYWARLIFSRVMNMCSYNDIKGVDEIQLDCDWTASTRLPFFNLCKAMKEEMATHTDAKGMRLSSTIRLHQLRQEPPLADCGVLMVYNTGSFLNPDAKNSILNYDDVKPYLDYLKDYSLHLDYAYPIYRWGLVYRNDRFEGLLRDTDISQLHTKKLKDGRYMVLSDGYISGKKVLKDDIIRIENSDYETIAKVKSAIDKLVDNDHSNILYHLSSENINSYKEVEINELYK